MSSMRDYLNGISNRLVPLAAGDGAPLAGVTILTEDVQDLDTEIERALAEHGMLVLVGQPTMDNTQQATRVANMRVTSEVAVGEAPTVWREPRDNTKPTAMDIAGIVLQALQGISIAGFSPLFIGHARRVPDKKRQLWELAVECRTVVEPQP